MVLKTRPDRPVRPGTGLKCGPVIKKTGNGLKPSKQWKPTDSTWESKKSEVKPVNDQLGVFFLFQQNYVILVLKTNAKILKTNPKPKFLTLRLSHLTYASLCLSLTPSLTSSSQILTLSSHDQSSSLCLTHLSLRFLPHAPLSALSASRTLLLHSLKFTISQAEVFFFFFLISLGFIR